jgi:hypothetical protein
MSSSTKKQDLKRKILNVSDVTGKNFRPKGKSMSPMARLMATFYGIEQK